MISGGYLSGQSKPGTAGNPSCEYRLIDDGGDQLVSTIPAVMIHHVYETADDQLSELYD
jgi:hypothetical protein